MKVNLINYTGYGIPDSLTEPSFAWRGEYAARLLVYTKNTRLLQGEEGRKKVAMMSWEEILKELDAISKTLRSSWEFVDYTFEILDVTRAFTHQFVRTRTASYAQQAQRVVNMSEFTAEIPVTCEEGEAKEVWGNCMKDIGRAYRKLQDLGIPNQDCRGVLPTNVHTNIIVKMNLRTLADLVGKRDNLRAQGEYITVIRAIVEEVLLVHPWVKPFLYPERLQTPHLEAILSELLGTSGPLDKPRINAALKEIDMLKGTWG